MKNFELKPTLENIKLSLKTDVLGRYFYIQRFADLLDNIGDNTSIALNGNWGSGKTFFVKQTILYLLMQNTNLEEVYLDEEFNDINNIKDELTNFNILPSNNVFVPVYYDAWKNDNSTDPCLSIVHEIMQSFCDFGKLEQRGDIKQGFSEIVQSFANSVSVSVPIPIDSGNPNNAPSVELNGSFISGTLKAFGNFKKKNLLEKIEEEDNLKTQINNQINTFLPEKGHKMVIFVDELDRCRPTFAVELLERIKHYFDNKNIIFVFSTNESELSKTIKNFYGNEFDGYGYLDKFFDLKVMLPDINIDNYIDQICIDFPSMDRKEIFKQIAKKYNLSMREICRLFTLYTVATNKCFNVFFSNKVEIVRNGYEFCLDYIIPIAIVLLLKNEKKFFEFVNGTNPAPLLEIIPDVKSNIFGILGTFNYDSFESSAYSLANKLYDGLFKEKEIGDDFDNMIELNDNMDKLIQTNINMGNQVKETLSLLSSTSDYA